MDLFTRQYLETALWSSNEFDEEGNGEPLDKNFTIEDFAPETLAQAVADCEDFRALAGELLDGIDSEQAGHDFWLTRNGHGAGFWDRGLGEVGKKLTDLCKPYGSIDLYVGDDGKIYG